MSDETAAILAEVDRFSTRVIDPRAARPEAPMLREALAEILGAAREVGLLPEEGAEPGVALWEGHEEGALTTVRALARMARANTGVALAAHQTAAAARLAGALDLPSKEGAVPAVEGRFGIGRGALGRYLRGDDLDPGERALLADVYAAGAPRVLTTRHDFTAILAPVSDAAGLVQWALHERASLEVIEHPHAHGLDELSTISFAEAGPAQRTTLDGEQSRDRFAEALSVMSLGLVATALGAAVRAHALAVGYAITRRQGGKTIVDHAAVQALLASSRGAVDAVEAQLEAVAQRPLDRAALPRILALRAEAHPLLCRGINDALQVFGGMGYMRDTGLEKALRDANHLRVICGSPVELPLVIAAWERS